MRFGFCKGEGVHKPLQLKQTEREDEGSDHPPQPPPPMSGRKKAAAVAVRPWLVLNTAGEARVLEAGKQAIMQRTGLPARDLRILDPQLSYPSTILGRERAIVINLEHIKAIITAQEVLVINSRDPAVSPFVHLLQGRLQLQRFHLHQIPQNGDGSGNSNVSKAFDLEEPRSSCSSPESFANLVSSRAVDGVDEVNHEGQAKAAENLANSTGLKILPFEFIALEACLEAACSCLENEATTLENEAHPALDKLTSKISTLNLEHVRQIKSRLVAITGRVQKVRDELEHLLDDDEDMAEMYLTDKLLTQQQLSNGSPQSSQNQFSNINGKRIATKTLSVENDIQNNYDHNDLFSGSSMILGDEHGSYTFSTCSSRHLNVEELEMLLEAYFVQIDSTLNKLSALREYVDDTEDYINLMLDDKQNHLLQMGVVLMTATMIISAFIVLVAIFGMNIKVSLFDENKASTTDFWWTVGGGATGSLLLYGLTITWCKHKGLLE